MTNILEPYLEYNFMENDFSLTETTTKLSKLVPCMMALYAKLHTIHKHYGTYSSRFSSPPTYTEDIELPLPFADASQNFGVFETRSMRKRYLMIPVFPEGTKHEGRSTEEWDYSQYKAYVPSLKECGLSVKSNDTTTKTGSAWWTYRIKKVGLTYDLECILPFLHYSDHSAIVMSNKGHYSDHSAIVMSMFVVYDNDTSEPIQLVKLKDDDANYGVRLRKMAPGFPLRSFAGSCGAPREEREFGI